MAGDFDAAGPGDYASAPYSAAETAEFDNFGNGSTLAVVAGISFTAADLFLGPFELVNNSLSDLTRVVTYGGVSLTSLGVAQWGTLQGWTEVFVGIGVPGGKAHVKARVSGGGSSARRLLADVVTYSGVESIGTPITGSGTGTSMSIAGTADPADVLVGVFGTSAGISGFNRSTRFLSNQGLALLIGDTPGVGSSLSLTATRQKSGAWGGMVIPLQAAPAVATCNPLVSVPQFNSRVRRMPREGGLRRHVFTVPAE